MRDLIVAAIVFGSIPFILRYAYVGVLMWSWLSYMNPHRLTWGFAYDFPFAQIVAITTFIALFFDRSPKTFPWKPLTVLWLLFVAWMVVTTVFAIYPALAYEQLVKVLKIQLITLLTLVLISSRAQLHLLVCVITGSIAFFGIKGGIFTLLVGGEYRVYGPPGSFIAENNAMALATLMTIPLMEYLRRQATARWVRAGFVAAMLLCAISALGSHSRGAFLAGLALAAFFFWNSRNRIITALVAVGVILPVGLMMPDSWQARIMTITGSGRADVSDIESMRLRGRDENLSAPIGSRDWLGYWPNEFSALGRVNAWNYAINVANARFTGAGFESWSAETFAQYAPIVEEVQSSHSVVFGVLADHGWLGLVLFLSIYFVAWRYASWVIGRTRGDRELQWACDLMVAVRLSIVAYFIGGAFLSLSYFDLPWHLVAIILICRSIVDVELRDRPLAQVTRSRAAVIGSAKTAVANERAAGLAGKNAS